ncbi:MAG: hypothetical protein KGS45_01655 [Planctomycetes bacterium]|nr:hypothetical protein [Planctomycetota bacterium]
MSRLTSSNLLSALVSPTLVRSATLLTLGCVVVYASGCSAPVARRSAGVWAGDSGVSAAVSFLPDGPRSNSAADEYWAAQADNTRRDAALGNISQSYEPMSMWPDRDAPQIDRPYYINTWRSSESYLIFRQGSRDERGYWRYR